MRAIVIYVGRAAYTNYQFGISRKIWGFKAQRPPSGQFAPGDFVIFGCAAAGAGPQNPHEVWTTANLSELAWAQVTKPITKDRTPLWPDEQAAGHAIYPLRFGFSDPKRIEGPVPLTDRLRVSTDVVEALRLSGINKTGQVIELQQWPPDGNVRPPTSPEVGQKRGNGPDKPPKPIDHSISEIVNYIQSKGYYFHPTSIRKVYAAIRSKPFAILAGNSGTGKSRLIRLFAEASGATVANGRFTMIPVRPDWNDSSELLGYLDLKGDFIPGQLVAPLLMAHVEPQKPFFVCLDEMNLARVEHYFSDFLSIVESRRREGAAIISDPVLQLVQLQKMKEDGLRPEARAARGKLLSTARPLGLPENLFVAGTVNMDETTQPFSRKVLDRAHTLEFNDIDLLQGIDEEPAAAEVPPLDLDQSFFKPEFSSLADLLPAQRDKARTITSFVEELNTALSKGNFEVGYRVRDEAISFAVYAELAGLSADEINEAIVLQKILPRIQGSSPRVETVLLALLRNAKLKGDTTVPEEGDPDLDDRLRALRTDADTAPVIRKIAGMLLLLREENFTSFWLT
jgi:hypothetical protein